MNNNVEVGQACPCGSKKTLGECCLPLINNTMVATSPEQLMRSRYVAFALHYADYLLETSSTKLAKTLTKEALLQSCKDFSFIKLEVIGFEDNWVEFVAHYLINNEHHRLQEKSTFIQENSRWKYDTGEIYDTPYTKLTRNDLCPCGSDKKFKKCHQR